jgi:hypothetical protein
VKFGISGLGICHHAKPQGRPVSSRKLSGVLFLTHQ